MIRSVVEWLLERTYKPKTMREKHAEYLLTDHWINFSREQREKAGVCQVRNCQVKNMWKLHTHHLHYRTKGKETDKDVIVLCDVHHKNTHRNKDLFLKNGKVLKAYSK